MNNNSPDNTLVELKKLQDDFKGHPQVANFIIVDLPENKGVASRNRYFEIATGKYLLQTDDDAYGIPGWNEIALKYFQSDIFAVGQHGKWVNPEWHGFDYGWPLVGDYIDFLTGFGTLFGNIDFKMLMFPEDWDFWSEEAWYCLNVKYQTGLRIKLTEPFVYHQPTPHVIDWELGGRMFNRVVEKFKPLQNELHLEIPRV